MYIREATEKDIPIIVNLLKRSLGEESTPKSAAYWNWKHQLNPFGKSTVLVAELDNQLVGVRAFMKWQWKVNGETIQAVRAVDTATHPDYQGKGIFKALTLEAVESSNADGIAMVFNTPNQISQVGYLKMGWNIAGRLPICVGYGSLFPKRYDAERLDKLYKLYNVHQSINKLSDAFKFPEPEAGTIGTELSVPYLRWRYSECPVYQYGALVAQGYYGFIFRFKKKGPFIELRLCEAWINHDKESNKKAKSAMKELIAAVGPIIVTSAVSPYHNKSFIRRFFPVGQVSIGPMVTVRNLVATSLDSFISFKSWRPSVGTMELF